MDLLPFFPLPPCNLIPAILLLCMLLDLEILIKEYTCVLFIGSEVIVLVTMERKVRGSRELSALFL